MRITKIIGFFASFPIFVIVGALIGLTWAIALPDAIGWATDFYDAANPVVRVKYDLVGRSADSVTIHASGKKLRGAECRLLTMYAYTIDASGENFDANIARLDRPKDERRREEGSYDFGTWGIWPVGPDAVKVQVWLHYSCRGRDVLTKVVDVPLGNPQLK